MDVVYACNDSYINQTAVSMVSMVKHNQDVCLHLVSDSISAENIQLLARVLKLYGFEINIIEASLVFEDINICQQDRHPRTIYAKLFLEDIIHVDKLLYMDSDTVVNGALDVLFQRDMTEELVAGVLMPYSRDKKKNCGLSPETPYICDGIVVFNMKKWRSEKCKNACIAHINQYNGNPPMQSEGTLNFVCNKKKGILSPEYNVMPAMLFYTGRQVNILFKANQYYAFEAIDYVKKEQKIIHFMNEIYNRPWFIPSEHPLKQKYLELEAEVFQGTTIKKHHLSKHTAFTVWLAKHLPFLLFVKLYYWKNGM